MPGTFDGVDRRFPLPLLAAAFVVCGCARGPAAPMPEALPVPAVMTVATGTEQSFLALTSLDTVQWKDQAAWLAVPATALGGSQMVTGYTLGPPSDSALVFWARGGDRGGTDARGRGGHQPGLLLGRCVATPGPRSGCSSRTLRSVSAGPRRPGGEPQASTPRPSARG